jgi:hypothetical protein
MDRPRMTGVVLLLILLLAQGPLQVQVARAQTVVTFEMSMNPTDVTAITKWNWATNIQLTGTVRVEKPPVGNVQVSLISECSASWIVSVTPDRFTFEETAAEHFRVRVQIPAYTMANEWADITIVGYADAPGVSLEQSVSAIVRIKPDYSAVMKGEPEVGTKNPQKFRINITNDGNLPDTYILNIKNRDLYEDDGFGFEFSVDKTKELVPREGDVFNLEVRYKPTTPWGRHYIRVEAISTAADQDQNASYNAALDVIIDVGSIKSQNPRICTIYGTVIIIAIVLSSYLVIRLRKKKRRRGRATRKKGTDRKKGL